MAGVADFALATARTTIRPWRTAEAAVLFDIHRRPEVAKWLGDPSPWTRVEQAHDRIVRTAEAATTALPGSCAIVPRTTGVPVGTVSLLALPDDDEVQLGWVLHPEHMGRGWATEAAAAMLAHALVVGHRRIWALMWPQNAPSAAVCRRLGMHELGVQVDPWYGTTRDPESLVFCSLAPGGDVADASTALDRRRATRPLGAPSAVPAPRLDDSEQRLPVEVESA
jgi:RimJ/RimL family protein N-acetyltransferase